MNPALIAQLIQIIQWGLTGLLAFKANDAFVGQFTDALKVALDTNTPLDDATWATIDAAAQAAHDDLASA